LDPFALLPLLEGWYYIAKDVDETITIDPSEEKEMGKATGNGWFISAMVSLNHPDAKFVLEYYDAYKTKRTATITPKSLHTLGLTAPNATGIFCPKFDTTESIYVVVYLPATPIPFKKEYRLSIKAPSDSPVVIYNYTHLFVLIQDEGAFIKSLRRAIGGGEAC